MQYIQNSENFKYLKYIGNFKYEKYIVGTVLWQETWKTWKMRYKHCMTWNME